MCPAPKRGSPVEEGDGFGGVRLAKNPETTEPPVSTSRNSDDPGPRKETPLRDGGNPAAWRRVALSQHTSTQSRESGENGGNTSRRAGSGRPSIVPDPRSPPMMTASFGSRVTGRRRVRRRTQPRGAPAGRSGSYHGRPERVPRYSELKPAGSAPATRFGSPRSDAARLAAGESIGSPRSRPPTVLSPNRDRAGRSKRPWRDII